MKRLSRHALGLGLRPSFAGGLLAKPDGVGYLELLSENFFDESTAAFAQVLRLKELYPVVLHGVGLNLLGHEPLDEAYLQRLARLADAVDAVFVTDHLCWTRAHGMVHHDLLPAPFVPELAAYAAARAAAVQARLGRPFGIENVSSYLQWPQSTQHEWDFYAAVVEQAGCWFMLDVNNIYVASCNHGFAARDYLRRIDFSRVLQVHVAGHERQAAGAPDGMLIDTHDQAVSSEVWQLYAEAWRLGGPFPTLLEWDEQVPPLAGLVAELAKAEQVRR